MAAAMPRPFGRPPPHQVHWEPLYRPSRSQDSLPHGTFGIPRVNPDSPKPARNVYLDGPVFTSRRAPKGGLPSPKMKMKFPLNPKDTIYPPRDNGSDKENQSNMGSRVHSRQPSYTGSEFSMMNMNNVNYNGFKRKKNPAPKPPGSPLMMGSRRPSLISYMSMSSSEGLIRKKRRAPPPPAMPGTLKEEKIERPPSPPLPPEPPKDYEMSDDEGKSDNPMELDKAIEPETPPPPPPPPPPAPPLPISIPKPKSQPVEESKLHKKGPIMISSPMMNSDLQAAIVAAAQERAKRSPTVVVPEKKKTFHEVFSNELTQAISNREVRRGRGDIMMRQTSFRKYYKANPNPPVPQVSIQDKLEAGMKQKIKEPEEVKRLSKVDPEAAKEWVPADDLKDDDIMDGPELNQALTARAGSNIPTYFHIFGDPVEDENSNKLYRKNPGRSIRANPSKRTLKRFKKSLKGVLGSVGRSFGRKKDIKDAFDKEWEIYYAEDYDEPPEGPIQVDHIEKRPAYAYNADKGQLVLLPDYERIIVTKDGRHIRESAVTKNYKPVKSKDKDEETPPKPVVIQLDKVHERESQLEETRQREMEIDAQFQKVRTKIKEKRRPKSDEGNFISVLDGSSRNPVPLRQQVPEVDNSSPLPKLIAPDVEAVVQEPSTKSITSILVNDETSPPEKSDLPNNVVKTISVNNEQELKTEILVNANDSETSTSVGRSNNLEKSKPRRKRSRSRSALLAGKNASSINVGTSSDEEGEIDNEDSGDRSSVSETEKVKTRGIQERLNDSGYRTDISMSGSSTSPSISPHIPFTPTSGMPSMMPTYGMTTPPVPHNNPMMYGGYMPPYNPMAVTMNQSQAMAYSAGWQNMNMMNNPYMWNPGMPNPYVPNPYMNPMAMGMPPHMSPYGTHPTTPYSTLGRPSESSESHPGGTTINIMYPPQVPNGDSPSRTTDFTDSAISVATKSNMSIADPLSAAEPMSAPVQVTEPVPMQAQVKADSPPQPMSNPSQEEVPPMTVPPVSEPIPATSNATPQVPAFSVPRPFKTPVGTASAQGLSEPSLRTTNDGTNGETPSFHKQKQLVMGPVGFRPVRFNPNAKTSVTMPQRNQSLSNNTKTDPDTSVMSDAGISSHAELSSPPQMKSDTASSDNVGSVSQPDPASQLSQTVNEVQKAHSQSPSDSVQQAVPPEEVTSSAQEVPASPVEGSSDPVEMEQPDIESFDLEDPAAVIEPVLPAPQPQPLTPQVITVS